ncbi:hypothetical protein HYPSUDRAFT_86926 [Hypholoma sublateritium FD-334 SS-4]|uniref:Uncharacterized protein n=1 Tax=Hypholoma sublateritium (strain FD-334 SS-4) TaxID=945553 RepID=A0A0D2MHB8_HYPSF|nr:hypothetical protein HYPSUDRAFT_86926 [Hypholoma sublateritium FD-334 SS-4]
MHRSPRDLCALPLAHATRPPASLRFLCTYGPRLHLSTSRSHSALLVICHPCLNVIPIADDSDGPFCAVRDTGDFLLGLRPRSVSCMQLDLECAPRESNSSTQPHRERGHHRAQAQDHDGHRIGVVPLASDHHTKTPASPPLSLACPPHRSVLHRPLGARAQHVTRRSDDRPHRHAAGGGFLMVEGTA